MYRLALFVLVCGLLAGIAACGQSSPASPNSGLTQTDGVGVGPGGITLRAPAPELLSPANGAVVSTSSTVALVVGRVQGLNASFPVTFEFDIAKQGGAQIDNTRLSQGRLGNHDVYDEPPARRERRLYLQVRADGPTGPVLYDQSVASGASPYRPVPHRVYIGSPVGANGPIDASLAGMIVKDFRVSAQPRVLATTGTK
jgi:hypothetical protein